MRKGLSGFNPFPCCDSQVRAPPLGSNPLLLDGREPDRTPVHQDPPAVGQVDLLDLAPEDRLLDPLLLGGEVAVGVGQLVPLAVDDQPHASSIAQAFDILPQETASEQHVCAVATRTVT